MKIISLEVRHSCAFSSPLAKTSTARATHLCHRGREAVLEIHASDPSELSALVDGYVSEGARLLFRGNERTSAVVQFSSCACCRAGKVIPTIEGPEVLYLPPSGYAVGGKETYQFLALRDRLPPEVLDHLPRDVQVLGVGVRALTTATFENGFLVPVGSVLKDLTDRQRLAIVTAIAQGYYRIPRGTTTKALGQALGISREAFESLLRKAENKLVAAWIPFLALGEAAGERPEAGPRATNGPS